MGGADEEGAVQVYCAQLGENCGGVGIGGPGRQQFWGKQQFKTVLQLLQPTHSP